MYFVYYHDDFTGNGGVGFVSFKNDIEALEFISERMDRRGLEADISKYMLIRGEKLKLKPRKVVTKVGIDLED